MRGHFENGSPRIVSDRIYHIVNYNIYMSNIRQFVDSKF